MSRGLQARYRHGMPDNEYLESDDAGWKKGEFAPVREKCGNPECGELMPRTVKRVAFGGRGRPRKFCSGKCRMAVSREAKRQADYLAAKAARDARIAADVAAAKAKAKRKRR